jgi:hypothetical protein
VKNHKKRGAKMKLYEAIATGKPHKRKNDNYVYFVPHVGGIGYSQQDVMADDWVVSDGKTSLLSDTGKTKTEPKVLNFMERLAKKFKKD